MKLIFKENSVSDLRNWLLMKPLEMELKRFIRQEILIKSIIELDKTKGDIKRSIFWCKKSRVNSYCNSVCITMIYSKLVYWSTLPANKFYSKTLFYRPI